MLILYTLLYQAEKHKGNVQYLYYKIIPNGKCIVILSNSDASDGSFHLLLHKDLNSSPNPNHIFVFSSQNKWMPLSFVA